MIGILNLIAAILHGTQAVVVMALTVWLTPRGVFDGKFALVRNVPVWSDQHVETTTPLASGTFDVCYAIIAFFTLSALFQGAASFWFAGRPGPVFHYMEYSLSASTAMCAIAVEAGIRDAYTLEMQFVLMFATMVIGIAAELSQTPEQPFIPCIPLHIAGWVTCLAAYVPAMDVYMQSTHLSSLHPPDFVNALIIVELLLFVSFGFVQTYMLVSRAYLYMQRNRLHPELANIEDHAELAFIVLSLTAKTVLCWIVLSPILA